MLLDLQRHKRDDHKPRCFTCDLEFATKVVLQEHLKTHRTSLDERKKYICTVEGCTKRYTKVQPQKQPHSSLLWDCSDDSRLR